MSPLEAHLHLLATLPVRRHEWRREVKPAPQSLANDDPEVLRRRLQIKKWRELPKGERPTLVEMARRLGISKTSVLKHLRVLRKQK